MLSLEEKGVSFLCVDLLCSVESVLKALLGVETVRLLGAGEV